MNFSKDSGNKGGKGSLVNGAAKIGKLFYPASFFKFFFIYCYLCSVLKPQLDYETEIAIDFVFPRGPVDRSIVFHADGFVSR